MAAAFNNAQTDAFFENGPQMALTPNERARLAQEGLVLVDDFFDFKEDQLDQAFKNMRTAIPSIPAVPEVRDADDNVVQAAVPMVPPILPILVSAKCALRLKTASLAYHYYISISRTPTPANMNYSNVLRNFHVEYDALMTLSNESKPDVPILHKNQTPLRWIESFKDCLYRTYGVRNAPLMYVIRENEAVTPEVDDSLIAGQAYGASGSLVDELINRLTHQDPLFKSDNAMVYSLLEEATRGGIYAPTIKPYARTKNGRDAWLSMVSSHAGEDKWEQLQKDKHRFLMNTKWNGRNYSLEKFTGLHRSSFIQLQEAAAHVHFQLPTEHTRVGYLIDNIENSDPDLRAAIASVRINTNGMRDNFERTVAFLLSVDLYSKSRSRNREKNPSISDVKLLKGKQQSKTGVDFRWHTPSEYRKLNKEQRAELYEWQNTKEGKEAISKQRGDDGKDSKQESKKKMRAKINSLEAKLKQANEEPTLEELQACIAAASPAPKKDCAESEKKEVTFDVAAAMAVKRILKRKHGK